MLRVLLYARILFSSSVSHVALHECGCAFDCDSVCDVCYSVFLALTHVGCCVAVGVPGCSTLLHIALRECFPCEWFVLFSTSRAVTCSRLFFLYSTVAAR